MSTSSKSPSVAGILSALGGFLTWGLFPVYWKQLHAVPAGEAVAHRLVWSVFFLLGVLAWQGALPALWAALKSPRQLGWSLLSSLLLTGNWTIYVWAVNNGQVIESSLGYFLVPLVNVALGRLLFKEHLRGVQFAAILLAAVGVSLLLVRLGHLPLVALGLAGTWSTYGLLKKKSAVGPLIGLSLETLLLFPFAALALTWWAFHGTGALGHVDVRTHGFIFGAGVVTAVPLVMFAYGAQRIRMTTLGLLQYLTPSVQFLIGFLLYREPFDSARFQSYALIWIGLAVYSADSLWAQRGRITSAATPVRATR